MTTPPKELSPERCHQLREGGFLRVLVNLLHEHTFESQDKPEADFNIELFLMDFNRKAELRARSSHQLQTIVKHTAKSEDELKILRWLEILRKYIERLYNFIVGWKAMTEDPSKLNECIDQLTKLAGQVNKVMYKTLTFDDTTRPIFEQLGGVFVIVDYIRAQTRFNAKCHHFESDQINSTQLLGVANDSGGVLRDAVIILHHSVYANGSKGDIRLFLGNSRSLHEIIVGITEDAYNDGDLRFLQIYCNLLLCLYWVDSTIVPTGVWPSTSHLKDCGVIQCLAKFGMKIKDPKTLYYASMALQTSLALDFQNALEFVSIDGAVDMLIDVVVPSEVKQEGSQRGWCLSILNFFRLFSSFGGFFGQSLKIDLHGGAGPDEKGEDVKNVKWHEKQRQHSTSALVQINRHLLIEGPVDGRLLAIYESRDFAAILVRHLELITSINESPELTLWVLILLWTILVRSEDQRRKITEMVNGKEVVKRFESSDNEYSAKWSKMIGEMLG